MNARGKADSKPPLLSQRGNRRWSAQGCWASVADLGPPPRDRRPNPPASLPPGSSSGPLGASWVPLLNAGWRDSLSLHREAYRRAGPRPARASGAETHRRRRHSSPSHHPPQAKRPPGPAVPASAPVLWMRRLGRQSEYGFLS